MQSARTWANFGTVIWGVLAGATAHAAQFTAVGADAASITPTLDSFRAVLGANNGGGPGPLAGGRREINWDGVPDTLADPNPFPTDFFNAAAAPRARGVTFSTPGTGFLVSADSDNPSATPRDFAGISAGYAAQLEAFSQQRLFIAAGSNITDVHFFVPGTLTPALTRGFGVVFSDVDLSSSTSIELYDENDALIETIAASGLIGEQTFSFAGAAYGSPVISRARIIGGNLPLSPSTADIPTLGLDIVAMDDFVYGEPVAVPEPAGILLLAASALLVRRR